MSSGHRLSFDLGKMLMSAGGSSWLPTVTASSTLDLKHRGFAKVIVTATCTVTLPNADAGTEVLILCDDTSTVTIADASGTIGSFVGTSGTSGARCTALDSNSWGMELVGAAVGEAATIGIADAGSYISSTNVETALQEIASHLKPVTPIATGITTVGAGTLTAAALVGGLINRSGSTAAYTDTTATGSEIIAALGAGAVASSGQSWLLSIKNTVAFPETIVAGADGITVSGMAIVPPNSVGVFLMDSNGVDAVTMTGLYSTPLTSAPLTANTTYNNTDATGTLAAAAIVGRVISRTGETAAYVDTTDTAAAIIAALPNVNVGYAFEFWIRNTVAFADTLAAGVGVTLAGLSVIPPNSVGHFLCRVDSASAVTITGIGTEAQCTLPNSQFNTSAVTTSLTAAAGILSGARHVYWANTADGAVALTTRTATQMFGDIPNAHIGLTYLLTIVNRGDSTVTLTDGGSFTISGEATVATTSTRTWQVAFTSATACTATAVNKGTIET